MSYVVTAPLVIIKDEAGVMHHLYEGAPVPDNADKDHLKQLVDGGMLEKVKASKSSTATEEPKPDTVAGVLKDVGDDKEKAAAALEAENAKDEPRKTLVEGLQAVIDAE